MKSVRPSRPSRKTASAAQANAGASDATDGETPLAADVRELARVLQEFNLTEIELVRGDETLRLRREHPPVMAAATLGAMTHAYAPAPSSV